MSREIYPTSLEEDMEKIEKDLIQNIERMKPPGIRVEEDPTEPGGWMVVRYHEGGWNTLFRGTKTQCLVYARNA